MAGLILVRHAMPMATPDVAPEDWPLASEGREAALRLRDNLPPGAYVVSSPERKARETAFGDSATARTDGRLGEVRRVGEPWGGDYLRLRRAYVGGRRHPGWEPHAAVEARFRSAVDDHGARANGAPVVVCTHGMALTRWLVSAGFIDPDEAVSFWEDLRFPDCLVVEAQRRSVERLG